MPDVKISALPAATVPLAGTEVLPIVQSATTRQVSVANLTAGRSVGGTNFIPSGSAVPTNGLYLPAANSLGFSTNSTNVATIDSSGNLLVGATSNPRSARIVSENASGQQLGLRYSGVATWYQNVTSAGDLYWDKDASEKMRIDANGNLLLGITSVATGIAQRTLQITNGTNGMILLGSGATQNPNPRIFGGDTYDLYLAAGITTGKMLFFTNDTERMRIPATGGVQAKTTISVGDATPSSSGAGITFPATQSASSDANTLDDYEEGEWTPTDGSGASLSFTSANGKYTKIGRAVFVEFRVTYPVTVNASNAVIASLPFTNTNNDRDNVPVTVLSDGATVSGMFNQGATDFSIFTIGTFTAVTNATLSTKTLRGSGWYVVS